MSFPTLQVRPNEKNPKILRAHEFLRQSNQLVERNLINNDGKKMLAKMLTKMVAEAKGIYALDEKRTDSRKNVKLMEQLKLAHQTSISVMEDRFVNADLARQVVEKKLDVQKKFSEIEYLRKSVQEKKLEVQREIEKNDKKVASMAKANEEMAVRSAAILKHLENSADVSRLRKMEEEKRAMESTVGALRDQKKALADEIRTKRATLKAEAKKPFKKMVIDCAKHYKLCQSLTPKLAISQRNVELLKEEEEARRASGSLDETIPFDRSFVLASMEKDTPLPSRTPPPPSPTSTLKSATPPPQKPATPSQSIEKLVNPTPIPIQEPPTQAPPISEDIEMIEEPLKTSTPVETQRIERQMTPEVEEMEGEEEEMDKDRSVDCMEEEEEEPMEQDEPVFAKITTPSPKSPLSASQSASATSSSTNLAPPAQKSHNDQEALLRDVAARLEEAEEVMSDNGSHRDDNFSFNFFGSANKTVGGGEGEENSNESETNFDFNFNANGSGDEVQSGGSGGFDFLSGSEENPASGAGDADPFGFGKSSGGGGAGDMSFNFNFDGGNGENEGGAGGGAAGNSTFFNF